MSELIRYWLWDGDESSTGGVAKGSCDRSTSTTESGAKLNAVVEGDEVFCPACKTMGYIKHIPPFRSMNIQIGNVFKRQCLEGDLCICKCAVPPVMKAIHKREKSTFEASELARMPGVESWIEYAGIKDFAYDQHFLVLNEDTGKPDANRKYRITYSKGIIEGKTDSNGLTDVVKSDAQETIKIELF